MAFTLISGARHSLHPPEDGTSNDAAGFTAFHAADRIVAPPPRGFTLGSDPGPFQTKPPACYRASWQLPGPDFHRQATTSLRTERSTMAYVTVSPPALLVAERPRIAKRRKAVRMLRELS